MAKTKHAEYYQLHIWELPVRFFHWFNALCVFTLGVTGFLMAKPIFIVSAGDASSQHLYGTTRFIHLLTSSHSISSLEPIGDLWAIASLAGKTSSLEQRQSGGRFFKSYAWTSFSSVNFPSNRRGSMLWQGSCIPSFI